MQNRQEFQKQVQRLITCFGEKNYMPERVEIIWKFVCDLGDEWFQATVSSMIATERMPPLPNQFQQAAIDERQKRYEIQRRANSANAREFMTSLRSEEQGEVFTMIKNRMAGNVPDEHWASFMRLFDSLPDAGRGCKTCAGLGVGIDQHLVAFKCTCSAGRARKEPYVAAAGGFRPVARTPYLDN